MEALVVAIVALVALVGMALIAGVAAGKGYSFWGFFVLALVAWPIALVVVLVLAPRSAAVGVGSVVRVRAKVSLDDGGVIPAGYQSRVEALEVIDGRAVVQVTHADGSRRWIAKTNTVPV